MRDHRAAPVRRLLSALSLAALMSCGGGPPASPTRSAPPATPPPGILTLGSVSLNPANEHEVFRPLADYLAAHLNEVGIGHSRIVVVDSLSTMVNELMAGRVDIYIDSPFPVAFVHEHSGARVILQRYKQGAEVYRSVIFARSDGEVDSLSDLRGRMLAFGEPFSTTGYLLPKSGLVSAGFTLVNFAEPAANVPDDQIGYVFSNDAENTMVWVLKSKVTAGAVNEDYFEALAGNRIGELKILFRSVAVPRNVVCVRRDLDPYVAAALVTVLLKMDEDPAGVEVLDSFEQTSRFQRFSADGEAAFAGVIDLLPFVAEDLGR